MCWLWVLWGGARSATACALPRTTLHELQTCLQMATICVGFVVAQKRPSCEMSLTATSARPRTAKREVIGIQMLLV